MTFVGTCPHCGYRTYVCEYDLLNHRTTCYCLTCGYTVSQDEDEEEEEDDDDE